VSKKLAGMGIGNQLVKQGVEYARTFGMKILPICPFARSILKKSTEYADVLH
jgi:predicted GNAT family acetyltransferase